MRNRFTCEGLESRRLFSAANFLSPDVLPAVGTVEQFEGHTLKTITWQGRAVRQFTGEFIVKLDDLRGGTAAQQEAEATRRLAAAGLNGYAVREQLLDDGLFSVSAPAALGVNQ